jgi:alcohol dehydrogenase
MVEEGRRFAAPLAIDSLAALGGGSSLDCAKGVNFVLTNGGTMRDYWGYGKASRPLLPMIGVPTTSGTGSEAQTYALISDAETHVKMACGDPQAAFRVALLDPLLTASAPFAVRAAAGYDAISHAVETAVTTRRNAVSMAFSRQAWELLEAHFERVLDSPDGLEALGAMQTGAYLAGAAIENSMLGAAHATANPLTARYGTAHGAAIALMLPHAVRFNQPAAEAEYRTLFAGDLARRLEELAHAARLPARLRDIGVPREDLPLLARDAAPQWTGRFNPRPFDESAALELYEYAW